ncbi:hypothetical protein ACDQ55_15770 [Chitinophaga sp. 30R24]|uniref:hypothetical protein n=1 Tax=Chitinophaga sp. 30R24 TaxID=3248838 RepID=UPI003B90C702
MLTTSQTFRHHFSENFSRFTIIGIVCIIIQLLVFKLFYPFADYSSDSYSYIAAALQKLDVNILPIGYSKFLAFIHHFGHSDMLVFVTQHILIQLTQFFLLVTISYFYQPSNKAIKGIFYALLFNPVSLYLSNYISSDAIFLSLSLIWFAQIIWVLNRPSLWIYLIHAITILITFSISYNAMYFPLVSILTIIISKQKIWVKAIGVLFPLLLLCLFVQFTIKKTYEITGKKQFSVFRGWQIANNALYMFPHLNTIDEPPGDCQMIHRYVVDYFAHLPNIFKKRSPADGSIYLKEVEGPLKKYQSVTLGKQIDSIGEVQLWSAVSPTFSKYGQFLIKQNPLPYTQYFIIPNTINYFIPPIEELETYNPRSQEVSPIAAAWFNYPNNKVHIIFPTFQKTLFYFFPSLFGLLNIALFILLLRWIYKKEYIKEKRNFNISCVIVAVMVTANAIFSILASPIVFKHQIGPMIIIFTFLVLLAEKSKFETE